MAIASRGVGLFASAGPSQLTDFVLEAHKTGDIEEVRSAFATIRSVMGPIPPQRWLGHGSARWRSFAVDSTPLDGMRAVDIPTFVAHGSRDRNAPVENSDMFVIELLRSNPNRSVFYVRIHDADHALRRDADEGGVRTFERFLDWVFASKRARGVLVVPPSSATGAGDP